MRAAPGKSVDGSTPAKRRVLLPLSSSTPGSATRGGAALRQLPSSTPASADRRLGMNTASPTVSRIESDTVDFNALTKAELKKRYNDLVKEYNEFMLSSNTTLEDGETRLEAMKKKLVEARDNLKLLNIDLEVTKELIGLKDKNLSELEEQLSVANAQIASHEDTIRQLMEALQGRDAVPGASGGTGTEMLDDHKLGMVRSYTMAILDVLGGNEGNGSTTAAYVRSDNQDDAQLSMAVIASLKPMFEEDAAQMPKKGFPDKKHFGFKDGFFYPFLTENVVGGNPLAKDTIFVHDAGDKSGFYDVIRLTSEGIVISYERYTAIVEAADPTMLAFVRHMKDQSPNTTVDELEVAKVYLDGQGDQGVRNLADLLVLGIIPPALRKFFTKSTADDEYVTWVKRGMKVLMATLMQRAVETAGVVDENLITRFKKMFAKQIMTLIPGKCHNLKKRDSVHHAQQIISEKFGLRFHVQGVRKLVSIAEAYATRNVLDRAALDAAMQEAYPKKDSNTENKTTPRAAVMCSAEGAGSSGVSTRNKAVPPTLPRQRKGRVSKAKTVLKRKRKPRTKSMSKKTKTPNITSRRSAKPGSKKRREEDHEDSEADSEKYKKTEKAMQLMFAEGDDDDDEHDEGNLSAIRHIGFGDEGDDDEEDSEGGTESDDGEPVHEEQVNLAQLAKLAKITKRIREADYNALDNLTLMEGSSPSVTDGVNVESAQSVQVVGSPGGGVDGRDESKKRIEGDGDSDAHEFFDGDPLTDSQIL